MQHTNNLGWMSDEAIWSLSLSKGCLLQELAKLMEENKELAERKLKAAVAGRSFAASTSGQ